MNEITGYRCKDLNLLYFFPSELFYKPAGIEMDANWIRKDKKIYINIHLKLKKHDYLQQINPCTQLASLGEINILTQLNCPIRNILFNIMNHHILLNTLLDV